MLQSRALDELYNASYGASKSSLSTLTAANFSRRATTTTNGGGPSIAVASRKKVGLGSHALSLTTFRGSRRRERRRPSNEINAANDDNDDDTLDDCVLVSGDRPTVVYASSGDGGI